MAELIEVIWEIPNLDTQDIELCIEALTQLTTDEVESMILRRFNTLEEFQEHLELLTMGDDEFACHFRL